MKRKHVIMYTDGACLGNPGPGGYAAILIHGEKRRELAEGYRLTTNNRMELLGVIKGLQALKEPCEVTIYSDSQYVVRSINEGWAKRWQENNWKRNKKDKAENPDLWEQLLSLIEKHHCTFQWVKGHAGNIENERADELSVMAAEQSELAEDQGFDKRN